MNGHQTQLDPSLGTLNYLSNILEHHFFEHRTYSNKFSSWQLNSYMQFLASNQCTSNIVQPINTRIYFICVFENWKKITCFHKISLAMEFLQKENNFKRHFDALYSAVLLLLEVPFCLQRSSLLVRTTSETAAMLPPGWFRKRLLSSCWLHSWPCCCWKNRCRSLMKHSDKRCPIRHILKRV